MAFNAGNAFVTVTPRFTGFQMTVSKTVSGVMPGVGKQSGSALGRGIAEGAKAGLDEGLPALKRSAEAAGKAVGASAEKAVKARDIAADAAGRLRVAEEKLTAAREAGKTTPAQLAAAEEAVATAQRKVEDTSFKAERAQKAYTDAMKTSAASHEVLQKATEKSEQASKDAAKSSEVAATKYATGWKGVGQRIKKSLSNGVKSATDAAEAKAQQGGKEAGSGFSSAFKGAIGGLATGFSIAAVGGFVKSTSDAAGEAEQSVGAVDAVFKENSAVMQEWAKGAKTAVGLSANEYRSLSTVLGAQLKNAGTPMEDLAGKTNNLIGLGADLSSMFGGTAPEAVEAISSALKGEMDPIEKYGISLSQASLEAVAFNKGLLQATVDKEKVAEASTKMELAQKKYNDAVKKSGKDSDEAKRAKLGLTSAENAFEKATSGKLPKLEGESKALAIQAALFDQSADAQGNFMREEDTYEHKRQVAIKSWSDMQEKIGTAFLPALTGAMSFITTVGMPAIDGLATGLQNAATWIQENSAWLTPLAIGVGAAATAWAIWTGGMWLWVAATTASTGAFTRLNAALKANWIYLVIGAVVALVAGVVHLWKTNEDFRNFFTTIWNGIASFFVGVWNNVLKPAFTAVGNFWTQTLAPALKMVWETVIKPIFSALGSFFKQVWENILRPVLSLFKAFWVLILAPALKSTWDNVIKPVFRALGDFFKWVWEKVLSPALDAVKRGWDALSSVVSDVWEKKIKPIFQILGNFVRDHVSPAFQKGIDAVKAIWSTLENIAKAPVRFMIDTVINKGLVGGFNNVVGWIPGVEKMKPIDMPPGFYDGGYTGSGHWLEPAGVVHAGELVIKKKSTNKLIKRIGMRGIDHLNQTGEMPEGYFKGGLVNPMDPGHRGVSAGWHGYKGHMGTDYPAPVGTPVYSPGPGTVAQTGWNLPGGTGKQVWINHTNGLMSRVHHLSEWLVKAGQKVSAGQAIGKVGMTGNTTGPHAHWGVMDGRKYLNPASVWGSGLGGSGDFSQGGGGFNPLQAILDVGGKIGGWFREKFPAGGKFMDAAMGMGGKVFGDMKNWLTSKLDGVGDVGQDVWGNVKDVFNGKDSGVQAAVRGVANEYGWGSGRHWDSLSKLINKESSWNPNAANPVSSARGLFQKMTSLHGAVEGTPEGQARWGLNYIKGRYGDPEKAWAFHKRNNSYSDGGFVDPRPLLHDNGGVLNPGLSTLLNASRKPEAVLSNKQWSDLSTVAAQGMQMSFPESVILNVEGQQFKAYIERTSDNRLAQNVRGMNQVNRQTAGVR